MADLWRFQNKEIEQAALVAEDEDLQLEAEKRVLANAEKLYTAAMSAHDALYEAESSAESAASRCPDCEEITNPEPPGAMTLPNASSTSAVPYKSTLRIVSGDACDGETPAAWTSPATSPSPVACSTSACTASREDASTVATVTS